MTVDWPSQAEALLKAIWTPELEPLFWRSDRNDVGSAWYGHVPFGQWMVRASAPRCLVELGSHNGVSYAAFCRAVQREGLGTRCFAIDTWVGDDHSGTYGEEVFNDFRAYHDQRFGAFSTLIRRSFDDAIEALQDGSIDLLHIDGRHGYEDVRHDFETWRGKMSERGVVLFHDTNVRENGFGVWRFWSEVQQEFPSFEFLHGSGLGVLAVGTECPPLVEALTHLREPQAIGAVRERFAQLGERCIFEAQAKLLGQINGEHGHKQGVLQAGLDAAEAELARVRSELTGALSEIGALRTSLGQAEADIGRERSERTAAQQQIDTMRDRAADAAKQGARDLVEATARESQAKQWAMAVQAAHHDEMARRAAVEAALGQIIQSSTWRATWPLRRALSWLPPGIRRFARGGARGMWRLVTPHLSHLRRPVPLPTQPAPTVTAALPAPVQDPQAARPAARMPLVCYVSGEPNTPGTIYRIQRYAAACIAAGAHVTVLRLDEVAAQLVEAARSDIVVIWRAVWSEALENFVGEARAHGARIVFDVDDLMIDPALGTVDIIDGIRSQNLTESAVQGHYAQVQRTMFAADYCAASTDELAGHMRRFGKASVTLPNGFDAETYRVSRMAVRRRRAAEPDGLVRLGYASGSRTHQRDFAEVARVLPNVLRAHPECRLVLFQSGAAMKLVDLHEFPELQPFSHQIEWRELVPLHRLPEEIARFDINLAPLQPGNPFCEAKSELKYFEGALAGVCTIASPVGPYARAIRHGVNGFLATTPTQWEATLMRLLEEPALRQRVAQTALNDVLWTYGPDRRNQLMRRMLAEWQGGPAAADAFVLELDARAGKKRPMVSVPAGEVVFSVDHLRGAEVTIVVPLYNYAHTLAETLDSVHAQTLQELDLVIVDDGSTDRSLEVALDWARAHVGRFNRLVVIRNHANAGLGFTRNAGFSAAETVYVLPLDADNLLRPTCCEALLAPLRETGAAFAYPVIQEFGGRTGLTGTAPYDPGRFVGGNFIDAMALIAKSTWSAAGGYTQMRQGWEDYDFWCAVAEMGLHGYAIGGAPLADYRAHEDSMLAQITDVGDTKGRVIAAIEARHPWVKVSRPLEPKRPQVKGPVSGLDRLLPILRCPETGERLHLVDGGLQTADGSRIWPLKAGRPILFPGMAAEAVAEFDHLSNDVPDSALALIRSAKGLVLNLSAGGTAERFDHVIEAEAAIFGHTDLVADSHHLPFADGVFEVVIAMNAFEHYRDPAKAAAEIHRVLQPGGRVLIRTAFLQPQHEPPFHFYNATRFGVAEWFADFETEALHVSENFNPSYALAWMAHECQSALQRDVGGEAARQFAAEPVGNFAEFWTDPAARVRPAWQNFAQLSPASQEAMAAGFEYLGRRPV